MQILPVVAELFHTDGRTARHDGANSRFRNFANTPTTAPLKFEVIRYDLCCVATVFTASRQI